MANQETGLIVQQSRELLPSTSDWGVMREMAEWIAKSNSLKGITTPFQAMAIMQRGRELGIPPMQALSSIYIVQGRTSVSAELARALILRDHGDDSLIIDEMSNERSVIRYKRPSWKEHKTSTYTVADAELSKLWNSTDTWKKYPATMLLARNSTNIGRATFPDTLGGMLIKEEADDMEAQELAGARNVTPEPARAVVEETAPIEQAPAKPAGPLATDPMPEEWRGGLFEFTKKLHSLTGALTEIPDQPTRKEARALIASLKEQIAAAEAAQEPVEELAGVKANG